MASQPSTPANSHRHTRKRKHHESLADYARNVLYPDRRPSSPEGIDKPTSEHDPHTCARERLRKRRRSASPALEAKWNDSYTAASRKGDQLEEDHFIKVIPGRTYDNKAFALKRFTSKVILTNLQDCKDPERLLERAIKVCMDHAKKESWVTDLFGHRRQQKVFKMGVHFESPLLDKPIGIFFDKELSNNPRHVLNQFMGFHEYKDKTLFGEPITIAVTTVCERAGSGRPKRQMIGNINDSCLIKIRNTDPYCLFYAIACARLYCHIDEEGGLTTVQFARMIKKGAVGPPGARGPTAYKPMRQYGAELMQGAGIAADLPEYSLEVHGTMVQDFFDRQYPGMYRIAAFGDTGSTKPIFKADRPNARHDVCIYWDGSHFHGLRNIQGLFAQAFYCLDCARPYSKKEEHSARCVRRCSNCARVGPDFPCKPVDGFRRLCLDCNKVFLNEECFNKHKPTMCRRFKKCGKCHSVYDMKAVKRLSKEKQHVCGHKWCCSCETYHRTEQACYIQKVQTRMKDKRPYRLLFADAETAQEQQVGAQAFEHEVRLIVCDVTCSSCLDDPGQRWKNLNDRYCKVCGPERRKIFNSGYGEDPLKAYVKWLFHELNPEYDTYVFSHNGGRFDTILTLAEIYRQGGVEPEIIQSGNKIYEMRCKKRGFITTTIFRDSYNLVSVKLDDLVESFELEKQGIKNKPPFPYLWITAENMSRPPMKCLPPYHSYCPEGMSKEKRKAFHEWYCANFRTPFHLPTALVEYCVNDVQILKFAMASFRREWMAVCGQDPLRHAVTIASACMKYFRAEHLLENTLVITPEHGYDRHDKQSTVAIKFLRYIEHSLKLPVQHAYSSQGEKRVRYRDERGKSRYIKLDGFVKGPPGHQSLAIEVNGCAWHGCPTCYRNDTECPNGVTAEVNYKRFLERKALIEEKTNYSLLTFWECEVEGMKKEDSAMRSFFADTFNYGPLDPRDGYFGGRTGPLKLVYDLKDHPDMELSYLDIKSLYPYTQYVSEFPVGRPETEVLNQTVNWCSSNDHRYKGLLKVKVHPPDNLRIPVLPARFDQRLLFSLCRTCSIQYRDENNKLAGYKCEHTEEERALYVTTTHNELNAALDRGYRVSFVERVWTWKEWSRDLFRPYISKFMKLKEEASSWPKSVKTDEQKKAYLQEFEARFHIKLDPANMKRNEGKRTIAKLCLNSLWGRFSMRNNLYKTMVTKDPSQFHDLIADQRVEISTIDMVSPELVHVKYRFKKDFVEENKSYNIFISLWTTSCARLVLYNFMETVEKDPSCDLLYTDTDSIILAHPRGKCPVKEGLFLGDMTREYPSKKLTSFYSGGAKQYALSWAPSEKEDPDEAYALKLRGITLTSGNAKTIHFETFKDQVMRFGEAEPLQIAVTQFVISKYGTVVTKHGHKRYAAVCRKGVLDYDYNMWPFGYRA